jgi:hypothetical protein
VEGTALAGRIEGRPSSVADLPTISFRSPDGVEQKCPVRDDFTHRLRTCKRRYCPRCGQVWARSWGTVSRVNLAKYGGPVALVSITAPGADRLPWACTREHEHSGPKGCRIEAEAADAWAEQARANWKKLRDAARLATVRALGVKPALLERVWEPQKRGVPHLHVVVGMATPAQRAAAEHFVAGLHRLAPEHDFGFVDRKLTSITAADAARYLTSYLVGRDSSKKATIRENIADPRMPRSLVWLTPVLTRETRVTMRNLRRARWLLAALSGRCDVYPRVEPEDRYDVAAAAVALERVRILCAARGPDARNEPLQLAQARVALTRIMGDLYRGRLRAAVAA